MYFLDLLGGQKWRVETMALFSLQQLFWLCLTPAPSGSYPSSVLLCSTNNQSLLYPNNSPLSGLLLINWVIFYFLDDLVFFFFAPWWIVLYFTGYAAFLSPTLSVISPLSRVLWSCSILPFRQKTLTWPCWPTFPWLCLTPLYAGGYPFVHLKIFPFVVLLFPSPPLHEAK